MELGTRLLGFIQPADETLILAVVDDGAVVGAIEPLRVELAEVAAIGGDKVIHLATGQQHIVGGDADLPGVEALAEDHPLDRGGDRHVGGDETGALATQLKGEGGELGRGGGHHQLAHHGGAGKEQVIERQ